VAVSTAAVTFLTGLAFAVDWRWRFLPVELFGRRLALDFAADRRVLLPELVLLLALLRRVLDWRVDCAMAAPRVPIDWTQTLEPAVPARRASNASPGAVPRRACGQVARTW
jgi:hypothetical protein